MTTETAQAATMHDPDFDHLEATISDEAYEQIGIGKTEETKQESEATGELLLPLAEMGHGVFMPNWIIEDEQKKGFCMAAGKVLDKYLPEGEGLAVFLDRYKDEIALGVIGFSIYFANKGRPFKVEEKKEEVEKDAA